MNEPYHIEICQRALHNFFSDRALKVIIAANLTQDELRGQFGHPEFHFDSNAFEASYAYIEEQRQMILENLRTSEDILPVWQAFGRLTHTAQDFYSHSNYLSLWADTYPPGKLPPPTEVDALLPEFLNHTQLKTNQIYLWDYLAYLPGLHKIAGRILPKDSHYHTHIDHPGRGPLFPYAMEAAMKRTIHEFEKTKSNIADTCGAEFVNRFTDR